jgi:hypothetical protein
MKIKSILVLGAILLTLVFSLASCKKTSETGTYTVTVANGVSGTPAAGSYTLTVGDPLAYSYSLDAGYANLTVLSDGAAVQPSGELTVASGNHTLNVTTGGNGQFTLIVTVATGITGSPAAGASSFAQDAVVNYSYAVNEGYENLEVRLDGITVENSGTITMAANHGLAVTAVKKYNIQGSWALTEKYDDSSLFGVTATFSGNSDGGTVTDSDGGKGEYVVTGSGVKFVIYFADVTYEYSGNFSNDTTMSGTCKRYQTSENVINGIWSATFNTAAAASRPGINLRRRRL